mmetsp:Transcript_413/g.782  ORF Transcript_413/g.782 Transcript_413/m.782 type:complete len:113 (+) Transcript_413:96-434(+)
MTAFGMLRAFAAAVLVATVSSSEVGTEACEMPSAPLAASLLQPQAISHGAGGKQIPPPTEPSSPLSPERAETTLAPTTVPATTAEPHEKEKSACFQLSPLVLALPLAALPML